MKTKILIVAAAIAVLIPVSLQGANTVKKIQNKSFTVTAGSVLEVNNEFGSVSLIETDTNEITIEAEITGRGSNIKMAEEMLERGMVNYEKNGNRVKVTGRLGKSRNRNCRNCETRIDLTITMPRTVSVQVSNHFGNIQAAALSQNLVAEVEFGNIEVRDLNGLNNNVSARFGNIETGNTRGELRASVAHGKAVFGNVERMKLNSSFSTIEIKEASDLEIKCQHDKLTVNTVGNLKATGAAFTTLRIGKMTGSVDVPGLSHGSIKISSIDKRFEKLAIQASFSSININLTPSHEFHADLHTSFGKISSNGITFNNVSLDGKDRGNNVSIKGIAGTNSNPKATVKISNSHSNIVFSN